MFKDFLEYFHTCGMSASNIGNYLTAFRTIMIIHGFETACLRDQRIPLFIKALKINRPLHPQLPLSLDNDMLLQIITMVEALPLSVVYVP